MTLWSVGRIKCTVCLLSGKHMHAMLSLPIFGSWRPTRGSCKVRRCALKYSKNFKRPFESLHPHDTISALKSISAVLTICLQGATSTSL
eukprot:jgi/Botrbrau1/17064/Bobra.0329s0001.1